MKKRLFIGISLPDHIKQSLSIINLKQAGFKPVAYDNIHLTLKFIGDVDQAHAEEILSVLRTIKATPFKLSIQGVGFFPPRGKPQVFWAGLADADPTLFQLQTQIDESLQQLGIDRDKRGFHPHITLARCRNFSVRSARKLADKHRELTSPQFEVGSYILYRSILKPEGALYHIEKEFLF